MENSMKIPQEIKKIELPGDSEILLLDIQKMKTLFRKDICTLIFTVASFTIPKLRKQAKCPSIDEWIKNKEHDVV